MITLLANAFTEYSEYIGERMSKTVKNLTQSWRLLRDHFLFGHSARLMTYTVTEKLLQQICVLHRGTQTHTDRSN